MRMRLVFKLYFAIDSEGKCDSKGTTSEKHSWSKFETMFQKFLSWMRCIIAPLEVFLGTKVNFLSVLGKSIQIEYSKWQWQVNKSTMISRCVNLLPCFLRLHQRPPIFKSVFVASPSFSRVPPSLPCQWSSSTATTWTTMPSQLTTSPRLWCKAGHCMDNRICLFLNIRHLSLASAFVTSWVMSPSSCIPEWKCRKQQTHLKRVKARFCWEIKEYKTSLDSCIHYFILGALKSTSWLDPNPIDPTDLDKCAMAFFPVQQLSSCRTAGREPEEFFTVGLPQGNHLWEVVQSPTSWKLRGSSDQRKTGRELWIKHLKESGMTEKMLHAPAPTPMFCSSTSRWLPQILSITTVHGSIRPVFDDKNLRASQETRREWSKHSRNKSPPLAGGTPCKGQRNAQVAMDCCWHSVSLSIGVDKSETRLPEFIGNSYYTIYM